MPYSITTAKGEVVAADSQETVLESAERAGVKFAYSCRVGRCSTCKAHVADGETTAVADEVGLSSAQREAGWILTCVRKVTSDVVLDQDNEIDEDLPQVRTIPCRIDSLKLLAPEVLEAVLRIPPRSGWDYRPGQHIELIGPSGVRRAYSVAERYATDRIVLHIRRVDSGVLSEYWFRHARTEDVLRLRGPLGTFFIRRQSPGPLVLMATGTGLAPITAMLQQLAETNYEGEVHAYHGGRVLSDLYWSPTNVPGSDRWRWTQVLSRAAIDWGGPTGYVQDRVLLDDIDLSKADVYACGSERMIDAAYSSLTAAGLRQERFFADSFVSSSPPGGEL